MLPIKNDTVLANPSIHNFFIREGEEVRKENAANKYSNETNHGMYPRCFMLGMNKRGIITRALRINQEGGGCVKMPNLSNAILSDVVITMARDELMLCGIARIGTFDLAQSDRGDSLREISSMGEGAFVLSLSINEGMRIESMPNPKFSSQIKRFEYAVAR